MFLPGKAEETSSDPAWKGPAMTSQTLRRLEKIEELNGGWSHAKFEEDFCADREKT
jgi:hypothetical protein